MNTNTVIPEFIVGQSAQQVHSALCQAVKTMEKAEHCSVLWFGEIARRKLYIKLGYSSIYQYAAQELNFSSTRTGDFLMLAKRLDELPILKQSVASGKLGYTKAREVIKVATPATENEWVKTALSKPRRELTKQIGLARKRAQIQSKANPDQGVLLPSEPISPPVETPVRVSIEMTPAQYARYEALWEKLHKLGGLPVNKADVLLAALDELIASKTTRRGAIIEARGDISGHAACDGSGNVSGSISGPTAAPARHHTQIHIHQCPDCQKASIQTNRGELLLSRAELERAQCDASIKHADRPNKATIAPSIRQMVMSRDRHICQAPGCTNSHFLEVHHIRPRNLGGDNRPENLVTLCSGCHRVYHKKGWIEAGFVANSPRV